MRMRIVGGLLAVALVLLPAGGAAEQEAEPPTSGATTEARYLEQLGEQERTLGAHHPDVADTLLKLGDLYRERPGEAGMLAA